eukprot:Em0669g3a
MNNRPSAHKADPEKKKASVRDTYKADPEKKASVRDTYKADPEKKKASVRDTYNANAVSKRAAKGSDIKRASRRTVLLKGSDIKRASRRTVLLKGSDIKRASRRTVLLIGGYTGGNSATIKAARRSRYWKGRRTTTTTQSYSLFEPNSRTLAEYGVRLEKAILRDTVRLVQMHYLLSTQCTKITGRVTAKTIRKVNAKKLQESDILVGHRFHTAGAEPYFFDNSKSVEENRAAKRQRYQEDVEENRAAKRQRYQEDVEENRAAKGSDIKRTSRRTVLLKGSDIMRTSRRTALLKGRNTRTIRLPLRHLKGIGIGMTPLSDWAKRAAERKRYRRGHRTTTTTQRCSAAPLPSAASSSSAAPTTSSSSAAPTTSSSSSSSAAHTASSRSTATVLAPVPPPPHRLLPPWPCHHPPAWLPWPEPGCRANETHALISTGLLPSPTFESAASDDVMSKWNRCH